MCTPQPTTFAQLVGLASAAGARRLIAIAGAPGSGKSTLAERLVAALNATDPGSAAVLPMDGYHLDDAVLIARGLRARKGAPDTFDVAGLKHMLGRLKRNEEPEIAVPVFDRDLEIARAGGRIIAREVRTLVVEGNYLLLDRDHWRDLRPLFDHTVMVAVPEDELRRRLTDRWHGYGLGGAALADKLDGNDMPNGRLIVAESAAADFVVRPEDV